MQLIISLREANIHLSRYVNSVGQGDEVIITRRGQPVARLLPVEKEKKLTERQEAAWQRTLQRMQKGFDMGGEKFNREDLYD